MCKFLWSSAARKRTLLGKFFFSILCFHYSISFWVESSGCRMRNTFVACMSLAFAYLEARRHSMPHRAMQRYEISQARLIFFHKNPIKTLPMRKIYEESHNREGIIDDDGRKLSNFSFPRGRKQRHTNARRVRREIVRKTFPITAPHEKGFTSSGRKILSLN